MHFLGNTSCYVSLFAVVVDGAAKIWWAQIEIEIPSSWRLKAFHSGEFLMTLMVAGFQWPCTACNLRWSQLLPAILVSSRLASQGINGTRILKWQLHPAAGLLLDPGPYISCKLPMIKVPFQVQSVSVYRLPHCPTHFQLFMQVWRGLPSIQTYGNRGAPIDIGWPSAVVEICWNCSNLVKHICT